MKCNAIYGQSGGPTSVINSSLYGVIKQIQQEDEIETLFIMENGIKGLIDNNIKDIKDIPNEQIELLPYTPSAIAGSIRYKLKKHTDDQTDYLKILDTLKKNNIKYIFLNGGNDSMDTSLKLLSFLETTDYDCKVIGIPKTIDNDLIITDHTPGYGSSAKFITSAIKTITYDNNCYPKGRVNIVEIMGRDAGWLTASSALCLENGPDLIYLPEVPFDLDKFLNDVKNVFLQKQRCLVAVSEGIRKENGEFIFTQNSKDAFAHHQLGGVGLYLASLVEEKLGFSTRAIELSLLQRCYSPITSLTDVNEAIECGKTAVKFALNNHNGVMVGMFRNDNYDIDYKPIDLKEVANQIKYMPKNMINPEGNHVTKDFIDYALPLINGENKIPFDKGIPIFADKKYF